MSLYCKLHHPLNIPVRTWSFLSSSFSSSDRPGAPQEPWCAFNPLFKWPFTSLALSPCSRPCVHSHPSGLISQLRWWVSLLFLHLLFFPFLVLPFFLLSSSFITCSLFVSWYISLSWILCLSALSSIRFLLSVFHLSVEIPLCFSYDSVPILHFFSWWLLLSGWYPGCFCLTAGSNLSSKLEVDSTWLSHSPQSSFLSILLMLSPFTHSPKYMHLNLNY